MTDPCNASTSYEDPNFLFVRSVHEPKVPLQDRLPRILRWLFKNFSVLALVLVLALFSVIRTF